MNSKNYADFMQENDPENEKIRTKLLKQIDSVSDKSVVIASSSQTSWGTIRWHPQWKLTTIKEQGPFGAAAKQIFEK